MSFFCLQTQFLEKKNLYKKLILKTQPGVDDTQNVVMCSSSTSLNPFDRCSSQNILLCMVEKLLGKFISGRDSLGQFLRDQIPESEVMRNPLNSLQEFSLQNTLPKGARHKMPDHLDETSWT